MLLDQHGRFTKCRHEVPNEESNAAELYPNSFAITDDVYYKYHCVDPFDHGHL